MQNEWMMYAAAFTAGAVCRELAGEPLRGMVNWVMCWSARRLQARIVTAAGNGVAGGATTPEWNKPPTVVGISPTHVDELGFLWAAARGYTYTHPAAMAQDALEYFNELCGWGVDRPENLEPDMFYTARYILREVIAGTVQLPHTQKSWKRHQTQNLEFEP